MFYVIFQFLQHSGLRVSSTVSATCNNRPYTEFSIVWQNKNLTLALLVFFLLVQIKQKTARCFLRYFQPCTFWLACLLNSFGYMHEPAVDRIHACVAKSKAYARIFSVFFC